MPGTFVHLGVQLGGAGLAARGRLGRDAACWTVLGCLVPDLPWIAQRALRPLLLGRVDGELFYSLRLHAVVQSSLLFSLVLATALALLWARPGRAWQWIAVGCLGHLLLDALQIKWANGVVLAAPISWRTLRFDLFWPESPWSLLPTLFGVAVWLYWMIRLWRRGGPGLELARGAARRRRLGVGLVLLVVWSLGPLAFLGAAQRDGVHYVEVLRQTERRPGRTVEIARAAYGVDAEGPWVRTMTEEVLRVPGLERWPGLLDPGVAARSRLSLRGRFVDAATLEPLAARRHPVGVRAGGGLAGVLADRVYDSLYESARPRGAEEPIG